MYSTAFHLDPLPFHLAYINIAPPARRGLGILTKHGNCGSESLILRECGISGLVSRFPPS